MIADGDRRLLGLATTSVIGAAIFLVAYAGGGYALTTRAIFAIALWWLLAAGVAVGLVPLSFSRGAMVLGGLFAAFAAWASASLVWTADRESSFNEFNRTSLYLAVLTTAMLMGSRTNVGRWADGLCLGVVAIAIYALSSRLLPNLVESGPEIELFLPSAASRLSFPVGYWNGLGILVSFGYPLCVRAAMVMRSRGTRALAGGVIPLLTAVIYLTSSRGAVATALVGIAVFLLASDRRWAASGIIAAGSVGSIFAVLVLVQRSTLVDGPLGSPSAIDEGRAAALLLVVATLATAGLLMFGEALLPGRRAPSWLSRRVVLGSMVVLATVGVVLAHPLERFESFRRIPSATEIDGSGFATAHLLSGNGNGRWQFWSAALDQFQSSPLHGEGAGSYESWWLEHASFPYFVKNAHSLYLEVLGELGAVGLLLLSAALISGVVIAASRAARLRGAPRTAVAALAAVYVAFLAGAGIDWVWQVTVVGTVGIAALGVLGSGASAARQHRGNTRRPSWAVDAAFVVVASVLIVAQAIPWLAAAKIGDSQTAVAGGDLRSGIRHAREAQALQPWAATPYLQLALITEQQGDLDAARGWIGGAIARDSRDWRVWFVASRIQQASGLSQTAVSSFERARALNPRSPIFDDGS